MLNHLSFKFEINIECRHLIWHYKKYQLMVFHRSPSLTISAQSDDSEIPSVQMNGGMIAMNGWMDGAEIFTVTFCACMGGLFELDLMIPNYWSNRCSNHGFDTLLQGSLSYVHHMPFVYCAVKNSRFSYTIFQMLNVV